MSAYDRPFDHVLIIMFENQYRGYVMENPYFRSLAEQGINMTNYFGVMHPSQTNYIASIAGELCNVTDDDVPTPLRPQETIVDLIEESPHVLDWRAYMETYAPDTQIWSQELVPANAYPYVIKHNPFSSFENIVGHKERWENVVGDAEFWQDIINGTLPNYAWFTPNMWSDGHYLYGTQTAPEERAPALVDQAAEWLEGFFDTLRFPGPDSLLPPNTLVVVTFDEADFEAAYDPKSEKKYYYDGPNQVYTVLLGDMIAPGEEDEGYNHYSLLRTIEKNFELEDLGKNDADANWFQFLWGDEFLWRAPSRSPLTTSGRIAAAQYGDLLFVVTASKKGKLQSNTWNGEYWSAAQPMGLNASGDFDLALIGGQLVLVYAGEKGDLSWATYTNAAGWTPAANTLADGPVNGLSMKEIDGGGRLMLAWSGENGLLQSLTFDGSNWDAAPVTVGFSAGGDIELAVIGPSVYLIYNTEDMKQMNVVSYNTADFNIVKLKESQYSGPYDNTTKNAWSPSVFPVAHFSHGAYAGTPKEDEPVTQPYAGGLHLAANTLHGVIHLVHPAPGQPLLLTEDFSISGIMTPKDPISYDPAEATTTNSGYGTLAQAGWSEQRAIHGHMNFGALEIAAYKGALYLFSEAGENGEITVTKGAY